MNALRFDLHAAAVLAPGMRSLADLRVACRSGLAPEPAAPDALPGPTVLPANERRRASQVVRLTLACVEQALQASPFPVATLRSVFAADEGTGEVCQQMLETLATTRQVSPLAFANSVHNAPAGYFSIAWNNRRSATSVSLGLESFASGLLCAVSEAVATREPVLFVAYDPAMTSPIDELLPVTDPTAMAWVLGASAANSGVPRLASFELHLGPAESAQPSPLPSWLPSRWAANSSVHGLAALGLLETGSDTVHHLAIGRQLLSLRRVEGAGA